MAEHRIAGGVHAAVAFGAVADDAYAAGGGFGLRKDIAHTHSLARAHAQVHVEGVEALDQRIAADVAENGLNVPALVQFAEMQGREAVGASRADHGGGGVRKARGVPALVSLPRNAAMRSGVHSVTGLRASLPLTSSPAARQASCMKR